MRDPKNIERRISLSLRKMVNDLQQILSEIEGNSAETEGNIEEKLIEFINSSENGIGGQNLVNSVKKIGIFKNFSDLKPILNKLFKERKIKADPQTFGRTKSAPIIQKTILLPEYVNLEHIQENFITDKDEIKNFPSFYKFVKNVNFFVSTRHEFGRRIPISEVSAFCRKRERNLTNSIFNQYLQDVNLLYPENFRLDPAGEITKNKSTVIIRGIKYSHIVILDQLM